MLSPSSGFVLSHVERLERAKQQIVDSPPGCVLLDLSLPDARRLDGLAELRALAPELPIVILSGFGDEQLAVKALQEGAQDYLVKGRSDGELLIRSINYAIERNRAERELTRERATVDRGTVTMLFTDLVGSTELLDQLGDERAEELRRTHFRLLRDAVAAQGGKEVKNLGDGLMVVFPSAVDAVRCAVKMQEAVDEHNRTHAGARLGVRVGLNVGEPIRGEDDYFGTPVVVAKRLCDSASGGQILASELVRALIGSRGGYDFRKSGSLELRGLSDPVPAYEIAWEPAAGERLSLPPVLVVRERTAFVGRTEELRQLREEWAKALGGRRRLVFVSGDAGIGKTRLAAQFSYLSHRDGATVLYGHAEEETLVPYQPLVEALRHHVVAEPLDSLRAQVEPRAQLKKVLPEVAQRLPDLPDPPSGTPENERYLLFEAVASLLTALSQSSPLLLVLEDLHWADKPTLLLLRHIARHREQSRIMIVGTYRQTEVFRADPLSQTLADLRRDHLFEHLPLDGLDERNVGELINAWTGHEARPAFVRVIHEETGGNPFFVEEVIRHLVDSGAIYEKGGRWNSDLTIDEMGIPEGVTETISRRLMRLSEPTYKVLSIASVIGRRFQLEVLERVSDVGGDALLEALEEAAAGQIIDEAGELGGRYYVFHSLFREALHAEVTATRRVRLHRTIGEVLEQVHADDQELHLGELAYHFFEARQAGEVEKAVDYARRAGDVAMEKLAYEEAIAHYGRALRAMDLREQGSRQERCSILLALGDAQERAGETADARETFRRAADLAKEIGDPEGMGRAALGFAGREWQPYGVIDDQKIGLLEEALAAMPEEDSVLRACVMGQLAHVLSFRGPPERTVSLSNEAVAMARRTEDPGALAAALDARHWALWKPDRLRERLAVADELLQVAEAAEDRESLVIGRTWRITDLLELGDVVAVDGEMRLHAQLAEELAQPYYRWLAKVHSAMRALLSGRFEEAERIAEEAGLQAGHSDAAQAFASQMFVLRSEQARLEDLVEEVEEFTERYPAVFGWRAGLCYVYAELGREAEAREALHRISADDFGTIPRDGNFLTTLTLLAWASLELGDANHAGRLYELLLPYADRLVVVGAAVACLGSVSHTLGRLAALSADWGTAAHHLGNAVDTYTQIGARSWLAHAQGAFAHVLERRAGPGDEDKARALLARSLQAADELGMDALLSRVR
jgi:class 3 adenylate cyclase/tetratricopeptide (TPR) repeat protein